MSAERLRRHQLAWGAACGVLFLALLAAFGMVPLFETYTLVRPADGIGPALGLLFGLPAMVCCTLAWLVFQALTVGDAATVAMSTVVYAIYLALPYAVWQLAVRKSPALGRVPRLTSLRAVLLLFALIVLDAVAAALGAAYLGPTEPVYLDPGLLTFLESFVFLFLLGIPCVLIGSRRTEYLGAGARDQMTEQDVEAVEEAAPDATAEPVPNPASAARRMSLSEFVVSVFLGATLVFVVTFYIVTYAPYIWEDSINTPVLWASFITSAYLMIAQLSAVGLIVTAVAVRLLARRVTQPVEALTASTASFMSELAELEESGGALTATPVDASHMRPAAEVRTLIDSVNGMRADLVGYVDRLETVTAERERAEAELDIARDIQLSAVPHDFAAQAARGLDVSGFMRPAREVGGDFYDVFDLSPASTALVVGDVSGKGVPASLFMMRAMGLIRSCMQAEDDLGLALAAANDGLCDRNDAMLFVTAFICVFDYETGELRYANAGHNPPSLMRGGVRTYLRMKPGLVLGAMSGVPYTQETLHLSPGDSITMYTDGVTEAADEAAELFGQDRLAETLARCDADATPACDLPAAIVADLDAFAGTASQADDITILHAVWDLPRRMRELPNEDRFLPDLFAFLEPEAERLVGEGLATKKLGFDLKLVCEEIFVNICHYASPGGTAFPVRVDLAIDERERRLYLTFRDGGISYDPLEHQTSMPTPDGPVGGLGIHLARKLTDFASYEREGDVNVLRLMKKLV